MPRPKQSLNVPAKLLIEAKEGAKISYFNHLNYSFANEDSSFEQGLLGPEHKSIVAIAGSGSRVLPLLSQKPERLDLVDLSSAQLMLSELKLASIRHLSFCDYLRFWGYPGIEYEKNLPRAKWIKDWDLRPGTLKLFNDVFKARKNRSLLYEGRWEQTIAKLAYGVRTLLGKDHAVLFEASHILEQQEIFLNRFPNKRWQCAVALLGNSVLFNSLLYHGEFPKLNVSRSHYLFYSSVLDRLVQNSWARSNFFLQLLFFGKLRYAEARPYDAQEEGFTTLKAATQKVNINFIEGSMKEYLLGVDKSSVDFVSFSDISSYFSSDEARSYLRAIKPALSKKARIVMRHYLNRPEELNTEGYDSETSKFSDAILKEKTQVYTYDILRPLC